MGLYGYLGVTELARLACRQVEEFEDTRKVRSTTYQKKRPEPRPMPDGQRNDTKPKRLVHLPPHP